MSAASSSPEGKPISPSSISSRLVEGIGVHSVINSGLVTEDHYSVGLTATISSDGSDISEYTLWWVGPLVTLQLPANQIFPQVSGDIQMSLSFTPRDQFFFPNSSTTQWASGKEAILRGEFEVGGGDAQNVTSIKESDWMYRIALVVTANFRQVKIVAQIIPVSQGILDSLTDPMSPDLCCLSFQIVSAPWSTPPDPSMKFYGPMPVFYDRRFPEIKNSGIYPKSQIIKKFVSRAMVSCSANPSLSEDEVADLLLDPRAHPPSRSAIVAEWPEIPPDSVPAPTGIGSHGFTPSQASQQTRGVPVIAQDQTSLTEAAQASLSLQSGRPVAGGEDMDIHESPPLSREAQIRRDVCRFMFPELPEDLPGWELMASMTMADCVSAIKTKKEEVRDTVGEGAESEAFMKATAPVVYSTTMVDDRLTRIHPASMLRAPLSEPNVWWHLMPKKLLQIVTVLPQGAIGMDSGISDFAIKKMSDRTFPLELRHILRANAYVEKAAPISKRRAMETSEIGNGCKSTWIDEYDFKTAEFPWEVLDAMMSAISVYQQLFPLDFSMIIITGTLVKFQLFKDPEISTKYQLKICHHFINAAFLANSRRARTKTPCLDRKQCDDQAIASLIHCKRPGVCPPSRGVAASEGALEFGQKAAHFAAFNMSNLGRAQIQQQQMSQRAQQYQQNGGGYGGGYSQQNVRGGGGGRGGGRGKPAAAGSANKSSGSIQVCPSFSKGEPCARGGDPMGSCKTVAGIILHHVCSICLQKDHGKKDHK